MTQTDSLPQRWLQAATKIAPQEQRATFTSFAFVFMLMAGWYILRPVRDSMTSDWSDAEVSWLWTLTFFFSVLAVSLYGAVASRIPFRRLVPSVYGFFALSFVAVYMGSRLLDDGQWLDKTFYVWVSVFSLFHISVFWSFMAELFAQEQAKRLFGFIGAGASIGAIVGPTLPALFVNQLGTDNLLLVAALLLLGTLPIIVSLQRLPTRNDDPAPAADGQAIGGNPLSGFMDFISHPYLLAIGVFIFLYTAIGSFVYFELKNLLADYDREARTQIWAMIDLAVNILTVTVAAFITGRVASRFGLSVTLASVPVLVGLGLLLLAAAPMVSVVVALQIVRRAGNYAVSRPGREMLFTAVDRETRFKTKPVIDIVVYRGGDMLNAWAFTALTQGLGLGLAAVAGVGAVIAAVWAGMGVYLGREFRRRGEQAQPASPAAPAAAIPAQKV